MVRRACGRLAAVLALSLLPALSSCQKAGASGGALTLAARFFRPDSATVVARWGRPCDGRGCVDAYRVTWTRAGVVVRTATKTAPADTLAPVVVPIGDSVFVAVSVVPFRRNLAGPGRTVAVWLRNPDAAPPGVDSLRVDTIPALTDAALLDSFPFLTVRDTTGAALPAEWALPLGGGRRLCALGRNRYTGEVRTFVPLDATDADVDDADRACAPARAAYAAERAG